MATVTVIPPSIGQEAEGILRVAAYCRVSSSSGDQLNSYMAQMTYYQHRFENSEKEQLIDIYADEGITGTRDDKRIEFQRMIADCRKGKIDRIYTKSISRFARNTKDCLEYLRELKLLGITVFFEKENIDTAKTSDELMITILGGLAQEESVSISKNLRWSYQKRMQSGTYITNHAPFGYVLKNGMLYADAQESAIIQEIFRRAAAGAGASRIAGILNRHFPNGRKWTAEGVLYILKNEKYVGDSLLQKSYTPDRIGAHPIRNSGEKPQYYVHDTHESLITRAQFEAAQNALANKRIRKGTRTIYPLTQKIRCSHCGMHFRRKTGRNVVYWVCVNHDIAADLCPSERISEDAIQEAFMRLHNKLLAHCAEIIQPTVRLLELLHAQKHCRNANVLTIHQDMAKLREQKLVLAKLRTKGFLAESRYQEQTAETERKLSKLQKQIHLLTQNDEEDEMLEQIKQLADYFDRREGQMIRFEPDTFDLLVDSITAHSKESLTFHLIGGLELIESL